MIITISEKIINQIISYSLYKTKLKVYNKKPMIRFLNLSNSNIWLIMSLKWKGRWAEQNAHVMNLETDQMHLLAMYKVRIFKAS